MYTKFMIHSDQRTSGVETKLVQSLVPGVTGLAGGDHRHPWPLIVVYISNQIFLPLMNLLLLPEVSLSDHPTMCLVCYQLTKVEK